MTFLKRTNNSISKFETALFQTARLNLRLADFLPLPKGEGRGEGERDAQCHRCYYTLKII